MALKTGPRAIKNTQMLEAALALKLEGYSYESIATLAGYSSRQAAYRAVSNYLQKTRAGTEEVRESEVRRLDDVTRLLWPFVMQGDLAALDRYLKVAELRNKLTGGIVAGGRQSTEINVNIDKRQQAIVTVVDDVEQYQKFMQNVARNMAGNLAPELPKPVDYLELEQDEDDYATTEAELVEESTSIPVVLSTTSTSQPEQLEDEQEDPHHVTYATDPRLGG